MKHMRILLLILLSVATSLACNLVSPSGEEDSLDKIPVTTEAVEELLRKIDEFEANLISGNEVELVITESELTSLVAFEMQKQETLLVSEIQVYLRDNQVRFLGSYRESGISLPFELVAEPVVNAEGSFRVILETAKVGPVAAPDILRDRAQSMLDNAVRVAMSEQSADRFIVSSVVIADGNMTIRGSTP
jgi:uncharacterized protein YpmS